MLKEEMEVLLDKSEKINGVVSSSIIALREAIANYGKYTEQHMDEIVALINQQIAYGKVLVNDL